ncbi:glycosyltransferase [Amycolatopsis sacchari]|uniref:Glycosyl transferases group 1 n=1 Tax=Amycolatopsis sacchari TaxID=115433 RepID=A0A1I3Z623_9PSEU|nr:glycosyltransferase [Amycolatopsis sacchari]SFK39558.1 Glycosyl transferases group 1 [Amycolatopsis sacchari]
MKRAEEERLRVLVWHSHGSYTGAFVRGRHEYLLPALPEGGKWGMGRAGRDWPDSAKEVSPRQLRDDGFDVVVLQRREELDLVERWTGRKPGRDVPAVFLEHNTPTGDVPRTRHFLADTGEIPIVHVTHYNRLMWDSGRAPTTVIEHGIVDPGERYTGEDPVAGVVMNEPVRRGRAVGADLLPVFAEAAPLHVFGIGVEKLAFGDRVRPKGDLGQEQMYDELARCRLYLHTPRWTSLGLSLLEAMHLGMPVVAVASTEAARAVPREAGFVSADVAELTDAVRALVSEPELAHRMGKSAREYALAHYGLEAFLRNWDDLLERLVRS